MKENHHSLVDLESRRNDSDKSGDGVSPPAISERSSGGIALNAELDGNDIYVPSGGEASPPPEFTPYEAEFFVEDDGDIVSHDQHLNEDGTSQSSSTCMLPLLTTHVYLLLGGHTL